MDKKIVSLVLLLVTLFTFIIVPAANDSSVINVGKNVNISENESSQSETLSETQTDISSETSVSWDETTTASAEITSETSTVESKPAQSGTPVDLHGQLSVSGSKIVDKNKKPFQLVGMSTHGIQWFPDYVNKDMFKKLRDDYNVNCIRIAMYVDEGGYMNDKAGMEALTRKGIDYCVDLGMYVIVDWHILANGNPNAHTDDAKAFFDKISKDYGNLPNIVYEICNEPNGNVTWNNDIKPYCEKVIPVIRNNDKKNIIIAGTPTWSQEIDKALSSPLSDKNTVYALHFYAATHTQWLRDRVKQCADKGLPIMVSEFGTCDASGNGGNNLSETASWLKLLDSYDIGYINWNLADKNESSSSFRKKVTGSNWTDSDLSEGAKYVLNYMKNKK